MNRPTYTQKFGLIFSCQFIFLHVIYPSGSTVILFCDFKTISKKYFAQEM